MRENIAIVILIIAFNAIGCLIGSIPRLIF